MAPEGSSSAEAATNAEGAGAGKEGGTGAEGAEAGKEGGQEPKGVSSPDLTDSSYDVKRKLWSSDGKPVDKNWKNDDEIAKSPFAYDPLANPEPPKIDGDINAKISLVKWEGPKDSTSIDLIGDGSLLTLKSSYDVGASISLNKDSLDASASAGTASELQYASVEGDLAGVAKGSAEVRSEVSLEAKAKLKVSAEKTDLSASFEAEAVGLQATGSVETNKLSFLNDLVDVQAKASGSLNAFAIGGSAKAYADYQDGTLSFGVGASASALFGAKVNLELSVNATKLVNQVPVVLSNPQYNPLAPAGQWVGNQIYDLTH